MIICRKDCRSRNPVSRDIRTSLYRTKGAKKSIGSSTKTPCVICAVQGRTNFHVAPGRAGDVDAVQGSTNFHVAPGRAVDVDARAAVEPRKSSLTAKTPRTPSVCKT